MKIPTHVTIAIAKDAAQYLVCSDRHCIVEKLKFHQVVLLGNLESLLRKGTGGFAQEDLAATKTDVRFFDSVVNFHNRTMRHIEQNGKELRS